MAEQPGLEVVQDDAPKFVVPRQDEGLNVVHDTPGLHPVPRGEEGLHTLDSDPNKQVVTPHSEPLPKYGDHAGGYASVPSQEAAQGEAEKAPKKGLFRKRNLIIAAVVLVVIIGAVVGGVVGSQAGSSSSGSEDGDSDGGSGPTSTPSPTPTSMVRGSSIGVIGDQVGDDYTIMLSYQTPDGPLQWMMKMGQTEGNSEDSWGSAQMLRPDYVVLNETGMMATTLYDSNNGFNPTYVVMYFNESSIINDMRLDPNAGRPSFSMGDLQEHNIAATPRSGIAAYGPWFIWQDITNRIRINRHQFSDEQASGQFGHDDRPENSLEGSKLVLIPIQTNVTENLAQLAFFYQQQGGRLRALPYTESIVENDDGANDGSGDGVALPTSTPTADSPTQSTRAPQASTTSSSSNNNSNRLRRRDHIESWPSEGFPEIILDEGASFAAFSIARERGSNLVNTYVLYIDDEHNVQQVWTEGDSWQTSSPEALRGLDEDTDIACISPGARAGNEEYFYPVFMRADTFLARCYYMREGFLREAQLRGTDWEELGTVEIP